jgi:DNA-binding transcriptional regulator/RsmH inhibitor MraZ
MRHLHADAREVELDAQGRMLLSPEHRSFARITDRAVFVGVSNVVEIVGEEVWDAESAALDPQTFTELGDRIGGASGAASAEQA